jgi:O-antigen/teichoic acid export membrane protein
VARAPIAGADDEAHDRQRRGTLQLLLARGVFFASAYVVSAILARTLGPIDYGIYGVVISQLFWLEMVVHAGVPAATSKLIADGRHDPQDVEHSARMILIAVSAGLLLAGWVFAPAVAAFMRIPGGETLYRVAIADLPFAAIYASYEGILYGHRRFGVLARAQVAYGLCRVAAVSALLVIGFSVQRALMAMVVSSLAVCALLALRLPPRGFRPRGTTIAEISRFAGPMALCLISGQILVNVDLWALKSMWTGEGEVIGEYVSALNLSRTLAVIPTVQAGVLFSSVAWASASGDRARAVRHIQEASRFAVVIAAAACVILGMNGADVLSVLFSSAYAEGQRFLPFQLVAFGLFALLDVFANALMATGRHRLVAGVLTSMVPLVWFGNSILIARVGPAGAAIALALGIGLAAVVTGALAAWYFGALIRLSTVVRVFAASTVVALASTAIHMPGPWVLGKLALLGGLYMLTLYVLREVTPEDLGLRGRFRTSQS